MIELLTGENSFELTLAIKQRVANFDGVPEKCEGSDLSGSSLVDIFAGQSLFATTRLIIIDQPSECSELWQNLEKWLSMASPETHVVLLEPKPDKRTSAYKWLQKNVKVHTFEPWGDRDHHKIHTWTAEQAKEKNLSLTQPQLQRLISRTGPDQWSLFHAVEKLSLLEKVTDERIDAIVAASPHENVFALLDTTLNGDTKHLLGMLDVLQQTEDAYRVFGLLTSQVTQLALLAHANGQISKVVQDTGAKPFILEKLAPYATRINREEIKAIIQEFAASDRRLKSTDAKPWTVIESTLLTVASRR